MADQKIAIIINAKDNTTKVIGGIGKALGGLGKVAAGLAVGAAGGIAAIGYGITRLAMDAAEVEPVRIGFENLAASIGETSEAMLTDLRKATRGTIDDFDLMKSGSKLMAMGLAGSSDEAAKLAEMASKLGTAMGEDAGASIENFTLMLANQSIPRLDSFGISSSNVRARMEELTSTTEGMTRETAFMQAVMEQGAVAMEKIGETGGGAQEGMLRFQASLSNLKTSIGTAFLPVLGTLMDKLAGLAEVIGPKIQLFAEGMGKALSHLFSGEVWVTKIDDFTNLFLGAVQQAFGKDAAMTIRDFVWGAVKVFKWLSNEALPALISAFQIAWPIIKKAVASTWAFLRDKVWPWMSEKFAWLKDTILPKVQGAFEATWPRIKNAVVGAWDFIYPKLVEAYNTFQRFWAEMQPKLSKAFEDISRIIREDLAPRFTELWEKSEPARKVLGQIAAQIATWIAEGGLWVLKQHLDSVILAFDTGVGVIKIAIQTYNDIKGAIDGVVSAIREALTWIGNLKRGFEDLIIPDWLSPGSPSPLEESIRGIGSAIKDLPASMDISARMTPALAGGGSFAPGGGGTVNNFNINIYANDYAGGRAAARGTLDELRSRGLQIA